MHLSANCNPPDLEALRRARHGVIEVAQGQVVRIEPCRWPKIASLEVLLLGNYWHRRLSGDRCWLYYSQPRRFPNFLSVKYVLSTRDCKLATIHRTIDLVEEIAELKRSDALLCDIWNGRISDRLLRRAGWESHAPMAWHRNYIKRFYGVYPKRASLAADDQTHGVCQLQHAG